MIFLSVLAISCEEKQENDEIDFTTDINTILDESVLSYIFDDVFTQTGLALTLAEEVLETDNSSDQVIIRDICPQITVTPANLTEWPKTVVLDYGNEGCFDNEVVKKGRILMDVSDRFFVEGSTWIIEFESYSLENLSVTGTKTVTFNGRNDFDFFNWDINVNDAMITTPGQTIITWESQHNRQLIDGENSPFNSEYDEYLIAGTSSGVNSSGWRYAITITEPLNLQVGCPWVRSGRLHLETARRSDAYVDFGGGDCNSTIIITIEGMSRSVNLF